MTTASMGTGGLRRPPSDRPGELAGTVESQVRHGRIPRRSSIGGARDDAAGDEQSRLHSMLVQVRTATLARIDDALLRLSTGQYGLCLECGKAIGISRLRELPFAERCDGCEGRRETHDRTPEARPSGSTEFFTDPS